MKNPLPPDAVAKITASGAEGRKAWKGGELSEAERHFLNAWNVLPDPKIEQDYAQSLSRGLTIFYRDTKQFEKAKRWIHTVREAYGSGLDDSVEFLAGTVAYDAGDYTEAFSLFKQLFDKFGTRPFQGSDRKYLEFYKKQSKEKP